MLWYIIGQAAVYVYFITINIIKLYIRFHVDIRHGQSEIFRINEIPLFSCMLPFKYVCIIDDICCLFFFIDDICCVLFFTDDISFVLFFTDDICCVLFFTDDICCVLNKYHL
jgi:hypothetical protein